LTESLSLALSRRMKAALFALSVIFLAGCAVHSEKDLAVVRAAAVAPSTVKRLENRGVLEPSDLIELHRQDVPDSIPIRHLRRVGVDYAVQRDEMRDLRAAKVSPEVSNALVRASQRFVLDRYASRLYWEYDWRWPYYDFWWPEPYHHHHHTIVVHRHRGHRR
jgi:hypothetical protein